jgi:hypothetical protein
MEAQLKELYENPEIGLSSKVKFYKKAKEILPTLTLKQVDEFLKKQVVNQLTQPINKKDRQFNTIVSFGVRNNYQIDLFILPHPQQNKGFKYLLTCIDVYSRFVDIEALKTKTGDVVLKAFQRIVERMGVCKNLNCDEGSEFVYKPFVKYCEDNDITVWMSDPEQENKNSIIERWHRTLRGLILKYVLIKSKSYIDVLPKIIKNYNSTEHRGIYSEPIDVWEGRVRPEQDVAKIEMKFKVGDRVRHVVKKATFDKASSNTNYTVKVYVITKIDGNSIYIDDLKKPFRDFELVKAVEDTNVENVKKAEEYNKKVAEDKRQDLIKRRLRREGMDSDLKA